MRWWEQTNNQNDYIPLHTGGRHREVLEDRGQKKGSTFNLFKDQLIKSLDINLFRNEPMILFYDITIFLFGLVYSVWTVYLVPHAIARGMNEADAAFLSTISGVTNFFGRVVYAPIVDRNLLDSRDMFAIISVINAVMFLTDPLYNTYALLAVSAAVVGFTIGAGNSLWTVMIKQFIEECKAGSFVSTLGWGLLIHGTCKCGIFSCKWWDYIYFTLFLCWYILIWNSYLWSDVFDM